ncbi:hypothetical protein B0H15DRAFT_842694 [Mycena belliarum]|uniref:G-protein coupled receptors family 2 profile 2 domain-containing protein n=1 Tax=Mycena belliarum TaxID=1033014 RepID=A0AAD6U7D9_9AGAR|nr:hypothetical protein B0H15DRAFT_842694 [Mycena belliae]
MSSSDSSSMASADSLVALPDLRGLAIGCGASGIVLMMIVLVTFAYMAWNPISRPYLNRVSFRLLVYALITNLLWLASSLPMLFITGPGPACTFVAFGSNTALMATGFFFFFISLNLVLVLVYGFNGRAMEKYYLIATFIICAVCNITPLAAGQYGFWARGQTCWFNEPDPAGHLRWLIGARAFPLLLQAVVEVVLFVILLSFMLGPQMRNNRVTSNPSSTSSSTVPPPPIVRYRGVVLRIGLYPLCSCMLNFTSCILDLYGSNYVATVQAITPVLVRIAYSTAIVFSLRGLCYALLAITDPSFIRAFQALRAASRSDSSTSARTSLSGSVPGTHSQSTMSSRNKRFSFGGQAIVRVEFERFEDRPSTDTRAGAGAQEKPLEGAGPMQETDVELGPSADEPPVLASSGTKRMGMGTGARRQARSEPDEIERQI